MENLNEKVINDDVVRVVDEVGNNVNYTNYVLGTLGLVGVAGIAILGSYKWYKKKKGNGIVNEDGTVNAEAKEVDESSLDSNVE